MCMHQCKGGMEGLGRMGGWGGGWRGMDRMGGGKEGMG